MTTSVPPPILKGLRTAVVENVVIGVPCLIGTNWAIPVTIKIDDNDHSSAMVPKSSEWFVVVDADYPFGTIDVFPSKSAGIVTTFQHQRLNQHEQGAEPWRSGKLCLDTPVGRLGLAVPGSDPVGNCEERLRWYLARAVQWIKAARTGNLVLDSDPFELPDCPIQGDTQVVHDESAASFRSWVERTDSDRWGQVVWDQLAGVKKTLIAVAFTASYDHRIVRTALRYEEARHGPGCKNRYLGIWWLWPEPIVLPPWQVPLTWGDLRSVGEKLNVNVDKYLREIIRFIRGREDNILLLGYPIPLRRGEKASEIHWQAISIPNLAQVGSFPNGFRPNERGAWEKDRSSTFAFNQKLNYLPTTNWHPERMQARGRFEKKLRESRLAVIGCGALGSILAELLIRGGVGNLLLVDHDNLAAGNLVRHTLSGKEVGKNKAAALASKLVSVAPFATINSHKSRLPAIREDLNQFLKDRDIVIDCTGVDDVLMALSLGWWSLPKLFVSTSVGYEAKRVFIFGHRGCSFPYTNFRKAISPNLMVERGYWSQHGETLEGAGCWSPLFPARMDDMMLAAASSVKLLEEWVNDGAINTRFIVFKQPDTPSFGGLQRVDINEAEFT